MKKISILTIQVLCVLLFITTSISFAQDTIVKRNNEKIIAKILEVNPTDIRYKHFDYENGPIFTSMKWELKYIVFSNGVKESFENVSPPPSSTAKKDLSIQPTGNNYYYLSQKISETDMLDIAHQRNNKKMDMIIKATEEKKIIKNCFLYGGIAIGITGMLTYTGVVTAFNGPLPTTTTGNRQAIRAIRNATTLLAHKTGGYLMLGCLASEIVAITFKFQETQHAHMVVSFYNKSLIE